MDKAKRIKFHKGLSCPVCGIAGENVFLEEGEFRRHWILKHCKYFSSKCYTCCKILVAVTQEGLDRIVGIHLEKEHESVKGDNPVVSVPRQNVVIDPGEFYFYTRKNYNFVIEKRTVSSLEEQFQFTFLTFEKALRESKKNVASETETSVIA
jgi:hypothetical protein